MILHLVRHPPPVVHPGTCYGQLDVPAAEVDAVAERLPAVLPPGLPVWTSPLQRCRILAERLHPRPIIDVRLSEIHFGDWEGRTWDEIGAVQLDRWAADIAGFAPPGGESARALQKRALDFVSGLNLPEAVLVTHAGPIRVLLAHWLKLPVDQWTSLTIGFGTVTTVIVTASGVTLTKLNGAAGGDLATM